MTKCVVSKHTPGPWVFSRSDLCGDSRFYIAQSDDALYTPNYSDVATLIAETVSSEHRHIQEANACLIAVAPELLEALLLIDPSGKFVGWQGSNGVDIGQQISAIIAKATGGAA